jgi:hypothetical protein
MRLGVSFYKDVGECEELAKCRRCDEPYTSRMRAEDLIRVEKALGCRYTIDHVSVAQPAVTTSTVKENKNRRLNALLIAPYSQSIRYTIDVVEPGRDQRDLQDSFVIEADSAEFFMVTS